MAKLVRGWFEEKKILSCPHCRKQEDVYMDQQFQNFECLHVSKTGRIQAWL